MLDYQQSISGDIIGLFSKASCGSPLTLRMAPLIDVIFLLLIFFFVSIGLSPPESFLPLELPSQQDSTIFGGIVEPLVIRVSNVGAACEVSFAPGYSVRIRPASVDADMAETVEVLREVMIKQKRSPADPVELIFDDSVKWDYTAKIYNLLFGLGIEDITFRLNE